MCSRQSLPLPRRDTLLKLEVVRSGTLNAIVFWHDLHLDDVETLSNGGAVFVGLNEGAVAEGRHIR